MAERELAKLRRRRGVCKASITRIRSRVEELEGLTTHPSTIETAKQLASKLESLDSEFKSYHFQIIDLLGEEDGDALEKEQDILDGHDDQVTNLTIRMKRLNSLATPTSSVDVVEHRLLTRKLEHLHGCIKAKRSQITRFCEEEDEGIEASVLEQLQIQISDYGSTLKTIHEELLSIEDQNSVEEELAQHSELEGTLFECSSTIRKLLKLCHVTTSSKGSGVKLPKMDVPTFDGSLLQWKQFWEQFCISVHDQTNLTDSERMVYLRHALKDGSAKAVIEGLAQSGEQYAEAVSCLRSRFDRPRLIHQTHVRMIIDSPQLRDGSGKELRKLHDTIQQHTRALKSMGEEPSPSFITSIIELKLDSTTMFEWQRHSQSSTGTPHYHDLLEFLDHRAQASEISSTPSRRQSKIDVVTQRRQHHHGNSKPVSSYATNVNSPDTQCPLCGPERHPLYTCVKFRALPHDKRLAIIKTNNLCTNCLGKGHFVADCKSLHRCRKCNNPHHTLLHLEDHRKDQSSNQSQSTSSGPHQQVSANTVSEVSSSTLLMTCRIRLIADNGSSVEARALLDSASSTSFVSKRLTQLLRLGCKKRNISVSGVGDLPSKGLVQSITRFAIMPIRSSTTSIDVSALVIPRITCDLPRSPVPFNVNWHHLDELPLADPDFGVPGRIDVLLGVDVSTQALLSGRRKGCRGSPVAMETIFGWVLCGDVTQPPHSNCPQVTTCHTIVGSEDDILRKFWEIEETPSKLGTTLSIEERAVIDHYKTSHVRKPDGRFIVPLPKGRENRTLGESRSQAVRRFLSLERSLTAKGCFPEVDEVVKEYLNLGHAEVVPQCDLDKPVGQTFYLPIHAVYKRDSLTTKVRAVFDASAKSSTGVSLNDLLLVGPTIHPSLIDVLLRFRLHRVALVADVSKMYRNVELAEEDKDLHRFVWRSERTKPLQDYRMTRVTFGVSASAFAANMSIRQNAVDLAHEYPLAAKVVEESIYVDDCLTGADNVQEAIHLYKQLRGLFQCGGFPLRKWNSSEREVLSSIDPSLRNPVESISLAESEQYTKALGLEWNITYDHFRLNSIKDVASPDHLTKRKFVSDISKVFDVLGWFAPTTIKMKILLQRLWELKIEWDNAVPSHIKDIWSKWRSELPMLCSRHIPRCYFPKNARVVAIQLHGFSDASENAYSSVVYIRGEDIQGNIHVSLVMAKTRVAPIKRLTIPRLELCGAHLLAELLYHLKKIYQIPVSNVYAWTDSTIVLNWLDGSPRRFKTYVGNRIASIIDHIPPRCWRHVQGFENPADCASRGLFPGELAEYTLWWDGPHWLKSPAAEWPVQSSLPMNTPCEEERDVCHTVALQSPKAITTPSKYSSFSRLQRVTAWIYRFIHNCRMTKISHIVLSVAELSRAEMYWLSIAQDDSFPLEVKALKLERVLPNSSALLPFNPFIDRNGIMRVGGRLSDSNRPYSFVHPIILHADHHITKLLIRSEHVRLLHAGPTLTMSSIGLRFRIIGLRRIVRSIVRACVICKRHIHNNSYQLQGQLPPERVNPGSVFEKVGIDYAGPVNIKYGYTRKPVIVKAYVCLFVSLSVKAVHLEIVSDLTSEAFIAALRRFISRRGHPCLLWSDNGTNFVGANRQLKELFRFIRSKSTEKAVSEFCTSKSIEWRFIPERSPHFGGLWEAAVKQMKFHLRRVVSPEVKLTFEEMSTVLCQIEACLNSRPLCTLATCDNDSPTILTPGHFLVGHALMALPDKESSDVPSSTLHRWHLCQNLIRHFWDKWAREYLVELNRYTKWFRKSRNIAVGDIVLLRDTVLFPTRWPLARVIAVHPGKDDLVRVVTLKTERGEYKRPITKLVVLIPADYKD